MDLGPARTLNLKGFEENFHGSEENFHRTFARQRTPMATMIENYGLHEAFEYFSLPQRPPAVQGTGSNSLGPAGLIPAEDMNSGLPGPDPWRKDI